MHQTPHPGFANNSTLLVYAALTALALMACEPNELVLTAMSFPSDDRGPIAVDASTSEILRVEPTTGPAVCVLPEETTHLESFEDWWRVEMPTLTESGAQTFSQRVRSHFHNRAHTCRAHRMMPNAISLWFCEGSSEIAIFSIPQGNLAARYVGNARTECAVERSRCPLGSSWLDAKFTHRLVASDAVAQRSAISAMRDQVRRFGLEIPTIQLTFSGSNHVYAGLDRDSDRANGVVFGETHFAVIQDGETVACEPIEALNR